MHALTDIVRRTPSGKNVRNTRVITQCRRTSQPDSSRMRASSSFERVFHAFLPKSTPIAHQRAQKKKRTRKPAFEEKGQLAIFLSETTRANGNLRFLLRAFLPFRESFILSDGHNVRSRQNYAGRRRCAKQAVFFFTFFFSRGRARTGWPTHKPPLSFAFYLIQIEFSPYFCLVLERRRARE